jgi:chromosome segregation ATPase
MIHFQQLLENLKREYLLSLRDYEGRIDDLQQQLHRNTLQIQEKNTQIGKLEAALKESRRDHQKESHLDGQTQLKVEDLQKRVAILTEFAEESRLEMHENTE